MTVTGVSSGINTTGITSIDVPGVVATEVDRMPTTFADSYARLSPTAKLQLASQPLDLLLTRQSSSDDPANDEENSINRSFDLPVERTYTLTAQLAHLSDAPLHAVQAWQQSPDATSAPCFSMASLDDQQLLVRPERSVAGVSATQPVTLVGCDADGITIPRGGHELLTGRSWLLSSMRFSSARAPSARPAAPAVTVERSDDTHLQLRVARSDRPYYLITGQAFDEGWEAFLDGKQLGKPILIDGYSVGWRIPAGTHRIDVAYGAQRFVSLSFALSGVTLASVIVLAVVPSDTWTRLRRRVRRRRREPTS